jgi:hypothetical protein
MSPTTSPAPDPAVSHAQTWDAFCTYREQYTLALRVYDANCVEAEIRLDTPARDIFLEAVSAAEETFRAATTGVLGPR